MNTKKIYLIGNVKFECPILNASGCWIATEDQIDSLITSELGGIVLKTCTLESKIGNPEPTYCKVGDCHINSKGLPNPGYNYYKTIAQNNLNNDKPIILSIGYEGLNLLESILTDYANVIQKPCLIEINMSCPNTEMEIVPYNLYKFADFLNGLHKLNIFSGNLQVGLKLPPYLDNHLLKQIAQLIVKYSNLITFITLSNSIPNCLAFNNGQYLLSNQYGGMSGKLNKFISISNVKQFADYFKSCNCMVTIIGCGGIESEIDINDYINMGANFVQLGSCFYDSNLNCLNKEKINELCSNFSKLNIS